MTSNTYLPGANYILPRNEKEFERLNFQHKYLTKAACDGRLVFDKSIKFAEKCSVLDSGTGTGIWAIDLANGMSDSVEIHASDISGDNFVPNPPSNVHFTLASVTSLPAEWSNKFDFVNQRLLVAALLASEWPKALAEIYRVVKPGGAIQLMEADFRFPTPETPVQVQVRDLLWKSFESLGLDMTISGNLPTMLKDAGFVDIVDEIRRAPLGKTWGEIGMQGTISVAGGLRNACGSMMKAGVVGSNEDYESLIDRLEEEWDVHGHNYLCHVVCARKPS
ncbi:S-adenosyl-L-methionine-dependent methyltransferase [Schizopora paradoxa]|uniref:S-adenosyl-L-methionine-dependent methyltransferase n=1 Tax=Schizopora paradoxa TaxID=27342 RepID=A0A0H2RUF7_9AGAM|nr:S-adenosyl-L-methionine-dependent methyltransferase [Schizopora paradoxa]